MNGIEHLRAFAKVHKGRVSKETVLTQQLPEPLQVVTKLTIGGERFEIRASPGYVHIQMRFTPKAWLVFAASRPSLDLNQAVLTIGSGLSVFVSKSKLAGNPYLSTLDELRQWLDNPDHARVVSDLIAEPTDAVAVYANALSFGGRAQRLDEQLLQRLAALRRAVAAVPRPEEPPLDVSMLPPDLAAFVRQFESLAEADDDLRQEIRAKMSRQRRTRFVRAAQPLFPALNEYLNALSGPWPDAAITLSQLGEFAAEILVDEPHIPAK